MKSSKKPPLLCLLFGHCPAFGYGQSEGHGYFRQQFLTTDGIGRVHIALTCDCERCGDNYQVGMIHHL